MWRLEESLFLPMATTQRSPPTLLTTIQAMKNPTLSTGVPPRALDLRSHVSTVETQVGKPARLLLSATGDDQTTRQRISEGGDGR